MKQIKIIIVTLLFYCIFCFLYISNAQAYNEDFMANIKKRAQDREQKRWTLSEWMEQQNRNKMMDLWLAMNSPSPYEAMLGFNYISYLKETTQPTSSVNNIESSLVELHAYSQIFGLSAEYENNRFENYNDLTGIFNLRIFGDSIQNSNITLSYGLRTRTLTLSGIEQRIGQQFPQISITLHIKRSFGLSGSYRSFAEYSDTTVGKINGSLSVAGIFIDFNNVRISGNWFNEQFNQTPINATIASSTQRTGVRAGLHFFF